MEIKNSSKEEYRNELEYFSFYRTQFIAGIIFLSVGITSLVFYDYGLISFLFAVPQFFLTGLIPMFIGILIIFRCVNDAEKVFFEKGNEEIYIIVSKKRGKLKYTGLVLKRSSIRYTGLKYKETKELRWIIILVLVTFAIEVHFQNAIDLYGYARIAPMLIIWSILMFIGIVLFTFSPRRYIQIANDKETIFIPFQRLPKTEDQKIFNILDVDTNTFPRRRTKEIIFSNIKLHIFDFILCAFLFFLGILLMITPTIFLGSFTRTIAIVYGMKLLLRVINGDPYFTESPEENDFFFGNSIKTTFIKTTECEITSEKSFSPLRFHPFEIVCIVYLIYQAIRYSFRHLWWAYSDFSIIYFTIGMAMIILLFLRWFKPMDMISLNHNEFTLRIKTLGTSGVLENRRNIGFSFKLLQEDPRFLATVILFVIFLVWPVLYIMFGGNFLII